MVGKTISTVYFLYETNISSSFVIKKMKLHLDFYLPVHAHTFAGKVYKGIWGKFYTIAWSERLDVRR